MIYLTRRKKKHLRRPKTTFAKKKGGEKEAMEDAEGVNTVNTGKKWIQNKNVFHKSDTRRPEEI